MKKRPRSELKARFGDGSMPSMSDFDMLIESTMNLADDGIEHSETRGLCLTQMNGGERRLLSFYRQDTPGAWALGMDAGRRSIGFEVLPPEGAGSKPRVDGAVLTMLAPERGEADAELPARVGINNSSPAYELDVNGTIASAARRGIAGPDALADGEWHTIMADLEGCVALEVMAGTGKQRSGKYALMHAFALKLFDDKGDITYHRSQYGARRNRLELRWLQEKHCHTFVLQLRVACKVGDGVRIRYHITELWDDPTMVKCSGGPEGLA